MERISKFGPPRSKHAACKRLTRYLRATERAIAEIDWQETPEGIEARRQVRARLLAVANRIAPVDWQRPRDGEVEKTMTPDEIRRKRMGLDPGSNGPEFNGAGCTVCPSCRSARSQVLDSRRTTRRTPDDLEIDSVRRRRSCLDCGARWTTLEIPADLMRLLQAAIHALSGIVDELRRVNRPTEEEVNDTTTAGSP